MIVIIAEKPSVARDIASVVGANEKKEGWLEGNGYQVTWAFGHLIRLANAHEYDERYKSWNMQDLPIIPKPFSYELADDPAKKKQYNTIKRLFNDAEYIIVATDAGREGEAIFRYIYNFAGCNTPFKRLWISSMTESAIKEGLANLKNGRDYDFLYYSAKCRNEADWLVGINATRALTVSSHSRTPLSLGRVQTPTLAIIVKRFLENQAFQPTPYYVPDIILDYQGSCFKAQLKNSNFKSKEECNQAISLIPDMVTLNRKKTAESTEKAPLPYDLTSLQADANARYKFKASKTLDIMQALYEKHKMLTYPRTASRYLGTDMIDIVSKNILSLKCLPYDNINTCMDMLAKGINKACFDNSKLTDHHAIIPTFENLDKLDQLTNDELHIFDMVARQLIMALLPPCKKLKTSYEFSDNLFANGSIITFAGWRTLKIQEPKDDEQDEDQENTTLPDIQEGSQCKVAKKATVEKMTKKPPLLSESSLLKAMESAGQMIEEEELSAAIKECGIGTPATRASIIEALYDRKYIIEQKNKLIPTDLGIQIYNVTKSIPLASPKMTGDWECKLNKMAETNYSPDQFMREIKEYAKELTEVLPELGKAISTEPETIGTCPICGKKVVERKNVYSCIGNKQTDGDCSFVVWKLIRGVKISTAQATKLLKDKKTDLIKGFESKEGKKFDAYLILDDQNKVAFKFPQKPQKTFSPKGTVFKK